MFILAVEGIKTEPEYFSIFNDKNSIIRVSCLKSRYESSPPQVLARMQKYLKDEGLKNTDEAWLVVDKDQWTDEQLSILAKWSLQADNYGLALSNPKFEFWLLLHFEEATGISNSEQCSKRLQRYISDYDKGINVKKISKSMILAAITRAKKIDRMNSEQKNFYPTLTGTTVYRLVEKIIESNDN
ncbi:RloB family protein [Thorsellia anophelis]|uniref:RloB-like protein n=2 Tax=Thorsellia TaxID=336803 RepID=A0A1I0G1N6_9GAMM|nr:RloB family protein [Thorsellia anophelis]SET64642.1 RloB-like protein [Thorsellia anophelis DSM 18579]